MEGTNYPWIDKGLEYTSQKTITEKNKTMNERKKTNTYEYISEVVPNVSQKSFLYSGKILSSKPIT